MDLRAELATRALPIVVLIAAASCGPSDSGSAAAASAQVTDRVFAGGVAPEGKGLENPFKDDAQSVAQGEQLFGAMNCDGCHGGGALGFVGPSLVDGRWRYGGADGSVFRSIQSGRPQGMPAYGVILSEDAIWAIVTYLRAQPVPDGVPTESWR
ncbi:MAG: c-type cytochrome [Gemmatimonadetes bacterium]|nr:c-type cytochrome [Gemmatimonadota bacterium]